MSRPPRPDRAAVWLPPLALAKALGVRPSITVNVIRRCLGRMRLRCQRPASRQHPRRPMFSLQRTQVARRRWRSRFFIAIAPERRRCGDAVDSGIGSAEPKSDYPGDGSAIAREESCQHNRRNLLRIRSTCAIRRLKCAVMQNCCSVIRPASRREKTRNYARLSVPKGWATSEGGSPFRGRLIGPSASPNLSACTRARGVLWQTGCRSNQLRRLCRGATHRGAGHVHNRLG